MRIIENLTGKISYALHPLFLLVSLLNSQLQYFSTVLAAKYSFSIKR
jgi:hypothetical protein